MKKIHKKIILAILGIGIVVMGIFMYFQFKDFIKFKANPVQIEIQSEYDPLDFIKKIHHYELSDVVIKENTVDTKALGEYHIIYQIHDYTTELKVEVVDSVAPEVTVKDLKTDTKANLKPEDFIVEIKDVTKTTVAFKKDYDFTKVGEMDVDIVVKDEGGNETVKTSQLTVIKDEEKPILTGVKDFYMTIGGKIDYLKNINAKDNCDPQPKVTVESSKVNPGKEGTYAIVYTVTDRSGNKQLYNAKVHVEKKREVAYIPADGSKVVYLTFDDGPSPNTAKVLDTLKKYNVKATFFVTGNGQRYNYLIKRAHQEGHTIALHTYTHDYQRVYASVDAFFNDLNKVGQLVKNQIGFVPKYIRFPGGSSNTISRRYSSGIMSKLVKEVQKRGYQYYDWNVSSGDASGNNVPVYKIVKNSTSSSAKNIMLLCHDSGGKTTTAQALPQIIEYYKSKGYVFKAIDDQSFTPHHPVNN